MRQPIQDEPHAGARRVEGEPYGFSMPEVAWRFGGGYHRGAPRGV